MTKNRPFLLFIVCLALAGLVWWDNQPTGDVAQDRAPVAQAGDGVRTQADDEQAAAQDAGSEASPDEGAAAAAPAKSGNPLAAFDKALLKDTVGRPLFAPSRKRPPDAVAVSGEVKAPPVAPIYDLMGVMHDGGRSIALMRKKGDGTSFRVEPGDMIGGWRVSKVEPQAVVLTRPDGESEVVPLFRQ